MCYIQQKCYTKISARRQLDNKHSVVFTINSDRRTCTGTSILMLMSDSLSLVHDSQSTVIESQNDIFNSFHNHKDNNNDDDT